MHRINIREKDPVRYARVKEEQETLRKQFDGAVIARLCPYCGHKIEMLYHGSHGACFTKCPRCAEDVTLPPVSFCMT